MGEVRKREEERRGRRGGMRENGVRQGGEKSEWSEGALEGGRRRCC